jgi:hypothetical protein
MCCVVWYAEVRVVKRCGCGVSCFTVWYYIGIGFDERKNKMSFMNLKALSNSIDFNVNSIYDVLAYFVDIASDCLMELRFVDCIDAYGLRDVLDDGVFYVPGAVCLGYRINR